MPPVHDYVIANGTGAAVRSDLNDALAAIVSNNSSSSEPATTYAYQWWADTTSNTLKLRNSANNAWVTLRELDGTMLIEDGSASTPGLAFADDVNTGLYSPAADTVALSTGGSERLKLGNNEAVFNDISADTDFRVESNGQTHMLFVNGGNDTVSIGTSTASNKLRVHQGSDSANIILATGADESSEFISLGIDSGVPTLTAGGVSSTSASLAFRTSDNGTESEAARIDSSGRLLVGTSSARSDFYSGTTGVRAQIEGTSFATASASITRNSNDDNSGAFVFAKSRATANGGVTVVSADDTLGEINWQGADGGDMVRAARIRAEVDGTPGSNDMPGRLVLATTADGASSPTERMRITASGKVGIGENAGVPIFDAASTSGFLYSDSDGLQVCIGNAVVAHFNRRNSDGTVVSIRQAGNQEGSISVSGSTVSYNGAHLARWSQLAGGAARTEILRGSVLSNLDEMCEWAYEAQDAVLYTEEDELPEGVSVGDVKTPAVAAGTEDNEQLNRMKVSDVEGDVNVAGVFQAWDDDDDIYTNDFYCAMTGDFVIRIAQGTTVARGDLLMSAGDGTAKPQDDDIVRSKTIAKVTSTTVSTTYSDGSYCVPCVLMAC